MSDERIAKLEALLARVLARKRGTPNGADGENGNGVHVSGDVIASFDTTFAHRAPTAPLSAKTGSHFDLPTPNSAFFPSQPPAHERPSATPPKPPAPATIAPPDASLDRTIAEAVASPPVLRRVPRPEPSGVRAVAPPPPMEVIELDIEPDPTFPPPPTSGPREELLESKSRLVSAPPSAVDPEPEDDAPPTRNAPSDPTIEVSNVEMAHAELEAFEEERAPNSSRRPISMEEKMSELDDAPPLHSAPPESGRLPAAIPAIELELEDSSTGVRKLEAILEAERAAELAARAPERTEVAVFVGAAPAPTGATFGEILDEALKL